MLWYISRRVYESFKVRVAPLEAFNRLVQPGTDNTSTSENNLEELQHPQQP